jgi:hypothetical protein
MAFNISDFSAQINRLGVAQSNLFVSSLATPNGLSQIISSEELRFLCRSVNLPELAVGTADYRPNGIGIMERRPTSFNYSPVSAVFVMDSRFRVLKFFHSWMQTVVNYDVQAGPQSQSASGARIYEFGFKRDYVSNMSVVMFSNAIDDSELSYTYTFGNIYPMNIGNITVAWENSAEVMLLPVTFSFDTLVVDGASRGQASSSVLPSDMTSELVSASEIFPSQVNISNAFSDSLGNAFDSIGVPQAGQSLSFGDLGG